VSLSLPDSRVSGEAKFPAVGIMIMGHKKGKIIRREKSIRAKSLMKFHRRCQHEENAM
jgi:hypothetical protein